MKYLQVCQVLYDYEARTVEEITIQENDIVYIIEKADDEWWKAELKQVNTDEHGPIGLVPANYLEEVTPIGKVRAEYDYDAQQEEELSFTEGQELWLIEQDDPDWYLVKLENGDIGLAPSNYVQIMDGNTFTATETPSPSSPPPGNITSTPNITPVQPPIPPIITTITPQTPTQTQNTPTYVTNTPKDNEDEAKSWSVHEYDVVKKKKKKGKGNLLVGNAMLCYGSETDKISPVQQYPILDVDKYLFDGKNLHIEIGGTNPATLDLQASSKSEAKAIVVKITDSRNTAQIAGTHVNTSPSPTSFDNNNNNVVHNSNALSSSELTANSNNISTTQNSNEPRWAVTLYSFDAEGGEEISIEENQQVLVTDYDRDDGWWRIETVDGKSGIIPTSYIQFYDDNDKQQPTTGAAVVNEVDTAAHDEVEAYLQEQEQKDLIKQRALQKQIEESEQRELQRRMEEEEKQHKVEQRRRDEEERERRRKAQEAARLAELARQQQMEEERLQRERSAKSSPSHSNRTVSRSTSVRQDLPKPDPERLRTWTDRSGSFKVEAQFLGYSDGKLRLHKENGVKIDVPLEKMSAEDIRWVERRTNQPIGSISNRGTMNNNNNNDRKGKSSEVVSPRQVEPNSSINRNKDTVIKKKVANSNWDWFDWFMMIGIPMQESLVYSSAFKADNLDDSDLEKLTHKQMKSLGMKESHVQRVERYIDTQKIEPLSDDEDNAKNKNITELERKKQIDEDEAFARRLQESMDEVGYNKGAARPKPNVSAPKSIHPDLLDFIGTEPNANSSLVKVNSEPSSSSTSSNKGNDLIGFNDDAWAPRPLKETLPMIQPLQPQVTSSPVQNKSQPNNTSSPSDSNIQNSVQYSGQQAQQSIISSSPTPLQQQQLPSPLPPQQKQQQQQSVSSKTIDPTLLQWQTNSGNNGFNQSNTKQTVTLNDISKQQEILKFQQQQRQQALIEQQQNMIMQQQQQIQNQQQQQQLTLQQQQAQLQQQIPLTTGFQPNNGLVLYNNGSNLQQPQITGYVSQQLPLNTGFGMQQQQSLASLNTPSVAAGQPLQPQPQQFIPSQPTGHHWGSSTPENPFGSPARSNSVIQPQMTGVQFSTPNPNAFTHSPLQQQSSTPAYLQQLQPQMTGIAQPELSGARDKYAAFKTPDASVFTQSGSMQFGQPGFSQGQRW
ncbi:hypothetical protein BJ944DRAFT_260437 [Cunninghamella echinulata]|nr:hypothetical protein BJ944DRAFT_260437 [Cunninghamella echinulata]